MRTYASQMAGAVSSPAIASDVAGADMRLNRLTGPLLGLVRVAIGFLWFTQTQWKMPPDFGCGADKRPGPCDWVAREVAYPQFGFYKAFLVGVIQPNLGVLGWFIYLGELTTAILLIAGLLTRLGGLLGFVQGVNLTIGLWAVPGEWYWTYILLALINLPLALTAAGRSLGVDALLHPRAAHAAAEGNRPARLVAALT